MDNTLAQLRVAATTLGCKVNQYETDCMLELLKEQGAVVVPFSEQADVYIVNTCAVTNIAERKSRQMLHRARKLSPGACIVACGCYVQEESEKLKEELQADLLIGNNRKGDVAKLLADYFNRAEAGGEKTGRIEPVVALADIGTGSAFENMSLSKPLEHVRAYIKVQDGCNAFCSYCLIPYVRGRERSRELGDVVREVEGFAGEGIKEVILTGINVSAYKDSSENGLLELIKAVCEVDGIERVRMSSVNPTVVTEKFVKHVSSLKNFCPHFHLSLQSACDSTLKRMNRHYTVEDYKRACGLLRKYYDDPAVTTDIIVGFPGETDDDFEECYKNLEELSLYEMHVFRYSPRKGTNAALLKGQVPDAVKDERSARLLELTRKQKADYEALFAEKALEILVEECVEEDGVCYMQGHTANYILRRIPDTRKNCEKYIGDFVMAF